MTENDLLRRAANAMRETHRQDVTREAETFVAVADLLEHLADEEPHVLRWQHGHVLAIARAFLGEPVLNAAEQMAAPEESGSAWTSEGVDFLRRVLAGEVYTGLSGEALARWAVGLDDEPRDRPSDRADMARCMNVYWSAPESLRPKMQERLLAWSRMLADMADGTVSWRFGGEVDFEAPRYYRRSDNLDTYWGTTPARAGIPAERVTVSLRQVGAAAGVSP